MDCGRKLIYFSTYENGEKTRSAGYAAVFFRGDVCDVQLYYRGNCQEEGVLEPVYMFRDGTVVLGDKMTLKEGMAAAVFRTGRQSFLRSGRCFEELEVIYLDGVTEGICGGKPDGKELEEAAYTLTDIKEETVPEEVLPEVCVLEREETTPEQEQWSLAVCLERFPELKLPFDGIRRKCCRMTLQDLEHLPKKWQPLKENHFLLHGYYEYQHLILAKLACRYGERYAIGVPGEFCYRNRYMAENFGFYDFAPLEPGKRRGGCFGYWYYYLENQKQQTEMI